MRVYRDRLEVTRGESFNYGVELVNNDGSPLIISNQLRNPYFLVTVASTKYAQYGRYLHNYWNKIRDTVWNSDDGNYMRFYCTTPITLTNLQQRPNVALNDTPIFSEYYEYVNGTDPKKPHGMEYDFAVYYDLSTKKYYYYDGNGGGMNNGYHEYHLYFTNTFLSLDTLEWVEQEYDFAMKLIDGNEIRVRNDDKPLRNYSFMEKLNVPEKIIVTSNLSGTMDALEDIYE